MLPGWDSPETAHFYTRVFTILGFVSLGLLVVFEVLAYIYDGRRYTLLEVAAQQAVQEQREKDKQREARIAAAEQGAEQSLQALQQAEEEIARLRAHQMPRHVTSQQREQLQVRLRPLRRHAINVIPIGPEAEVRTFGREIAEALTAAELNVTLAEGVNMTTAPGPNLTMAVGRNREADANILGLALAGAGLATTPVQAMESPDDNALILYVSARVRE
jgi:hypothetical protein